MAPNETEKMWAELAPYYDILYQWKDYRAEAARVHQLIQTHRLSSGNALLDAACGTGGHTRFLCEHYRVTGIDLNPEMLKVARRKIPGVSFLRRDMTLFALKRRFDAIVCLFSSIAYVRTCRNLRRTVACFAKHLKPGGILVLEPFFTNKTFLPGNTGAGSTSPIVLSNQCLKERIPDIESLKEQTSAWTNDRNNKSKAVHWRFTTDDARIKLRKLYQTTFSRQRVLEPFFTNKTFLPGSIHGGTMEGEGVRISRHNVSRRRGNLAVLDFHFLLSTKKGVRYFRDTHELALFDSERFLEILADEGLRPRFDKHGLMRDRGLYLALKES